MWLCIAPGDALCHKMHVCVSLTLKAEAADYTCRSKHDSIVLHALQGKPST